MNFRDILSANIQSAYFVASVYLSDLSDQDLLIRPVPNANHIAWQLGHLISSSDVMLEFLNAPGRPTLPEGFTAAHKKERAGVESAESFFPKATYLDLMEKQKSAALAAIEVLSEEQLDKPGPESMRSYAPTVGAICLLLGNHLGMHLGQFVVVRRSIGKPVLI